MIFDFGLWTGRSRDGWGWVERNRGPTHRPLGAAPGIVLDRATDSPSIAFQSRRREYTLERADVGVAREAADEAVQLQERHVHAHFACGHSTLLGQRIDVLGSLGEDMEELLLLLR